MMIPGLSVLCVALGAALIVLPPGMETLDAEFSYTSSQAFSFLLSLGPGGRRQYLAHQLLDLGFIVAYTALNLRLMRAGLKRRGLARDRFLPAFALVPGALDAIETVGIILACGLLFGPAASPVLVAVAAATPAKWAAIGLILPAHAWLWLRPGEMPKTAP